MQLDFGFGDVVVPGPVWIDYPELLDFGQPHLLSYTPESAVAEKFQAMVELEMANMRLKDFFDLWTLSRTLSFDGATLTQALAATFRQRGTPLPALPPLALTADFSDDPVKQVQWNTFIRKGRLGAGAQTLTEVVNAIADFLLPPTYAAVSGSLFTRRWPAGGIWQ